MFENSQQNGEFKDERYESESVFHTRKKKAMVNTTDFVGKKKKVL